MTPSIEQRAREAAKNYLKFRLGDRKGYHILDDLRDDKELCEEIIQECAKCFEKVLTAQHAEDVAAGEKKDVLLFKFMTALQAVGDEKQFTGKKCFCDTVARTYCTGQSRCKRANEALSEYAAMSATQPTQP